jgi:SAM-dependent methyltransferase
MQADLFRPDADAMLAELGDGAGLHVLDMCSGIGGITDVLSRWVGPTGTVIGAEIDVAKIAHARDWAVSLGLNNVSFQETDAFASGFPPASFDLVHSRFAVSVIKNGLGILDHMLTLVRPGGLLFLEEANTTTMECAPANPDWDRALDLMRETFSHIGADTRIGLELHAILQKKGLQDLKVRPCLHALGCNDPMTLHLPDTLAMMRGAITDNGLMDGAELDGLIHRTRAHLSRPETITVSFSTVQLVGRVS